MLETDTWAITADGKTMNQEFRGTKPNGGTFDDKASYGRVSGHGTTLEGKWLDKHVDVGAPDKIEIKANGRGESR